MRRLLPSSFHILRDHSSRFYPALSQLVTDRDKGVRAAALGVMEVAYRQEGPAALWKLLGRVSDQQRSLIEERLKYTDKQASAQVGRPHSSATTLSH